MRLVSCFLFLIFCYQSHAQSTTDRIRQAYDRFETDSQLRSAISSLYVIDGKTGDIVFDRNSRIGMATASTLKVVTAASAYEILGPDFHYETKFGYTGSVRNKKLYGNLVIVPSGDPTFGSWRYKSTADTAVLNAVSEAIKKLNIIGFGSIEINSKKWMEESIPGGWIWEDIGNYYGAGAHGFNWRENQVDVILKSGKTIGDPVSVVGVQPDNGTIKPGSLATSAARGSGDNAYMYYKLRGLGGTVRGTIPVDESKFKISVSVPDPELEFIVSIENFLKARSRVMQIYVDGVPHDTTVLYTHYSPGLDSIVYWFLRKSINLYGEALLKTVAYKTTGEGSTEVGVDIVRNFWKGKGIDPVELNIVDGSGLSPLNRITTHAQVQVLQYAKAQPWFRGYYDAFPVYNEQKMKSGTIRGVKGFCGYQTSKDGHEYIFSFLVNNYNGSASTLIRKMYQVLDVLK